MSVVLGLDIGTKTVTGAVFSGSAKKYRLVDFFTEEIQTLSSGDYKEDGEYVAPLSVEELVDRILTEKNLKGIDTATAVDTKDCVIREISVPFLKDEQIRKTVFFEAESHFTGFDLESTVLEYIKIGEHDNKSLLILAALRDEVMEDRLGLLKGVGVDPVSVDLDAAAIFNAYSMSPLFDESQSSLLIDMGTTSTKVLLVENGRLRKVRSLRLETAVASPARRLPEPVGVGAGDADGREVSVEVVGDEPPGFADFSIDERFQEIENALRLLDDHLPPGGGASPDAPIAILTDEEYDRVRQDTVDDEAADPFGRGGARAGDKGNGNGAGERDEAFAGRFPGGGEEAQEFDYDEYLQRIAVEIQRSFAGVRLDSPIEMICLTGGMSGRPEARRFFADEFDVETVQLDFGDAIPSELSPADQLRLNTQGAVAVGLAMKQLGHDRLGLDFRKGPFRFEHRFERVKIPVLVASLLLFFCFLQLTYFGFLEWKLETRRLEGYRKNATESYKAFFGEASRGSLAAALRKKKEWEGAGTGDVGRYLDPVDALRDFAQTMKDTKLNGDPPFTITSMDFKFKITTIKPKKGKPAPKPKGDRSQLVLETPDPGAAIKLETAFNGAKSKVFKVTGTSKPLRDDRHRVTMSLEIKDAKLAEYK